MARVGICLDCSAEVQGGACGSLPSRCTSCRRKWKAKAAKESYWRNPEAKRQSKARILHGLRAKNPGRQLAAELYYKAKYRAKRLGLPFTIAKEDIVIPDKCPVLGTVLNRSPGGFCNPHVGTLDRIIPELGYTPGNVWVISWRANQLKSNGTLQELEAVCEALRRMTSRP